MNNNNLGNVVQHQGPDGGDIHICGICKVQFNNIEIFLQHKRQGCQGYDTQPLPANTESNQGSYHHDNRDQSHHYHAPYLENQDSPVGLNVHSGVNPAEGELLAVIEVSDDGVISHVDGNYRSDIPRQNVLSSNPQISQETSVQSQGSLYVPVPYHDEHHGIAVQKLALATGAVPQQDTGGVYQQPTTHSLEEYNTAQSLLNVLQSGRAGGLQVTAATPQEVHTLTAPPPPPKIQSQPKSSGITPIKKELSSGATKRFPCDFSGCSFSSAYMKDVERHRRIHTGERPFSCHLCDKTFNRGDKLKMHIRAHTGKKPYSCNLCSYATADSSSLKKHMRIHTDERPFKCQFCQYASRNSSQLVVHLRTHTGDSPFSCKVCNAKFKINSDLKRHARLHTGEKPFKCDLCDYRASIKGNLNSHYKINHSTEGTIQCEKCEYKTSSRRALREHKKTHDPADMLFHCPTCSYSCSSKTTLKVHQRTHSSEKPYRCKFCNFSSKQSGNIGTHVRRKHADMLVPNSLKHFKKRKGKLAGHKFGFGSGERRKQSLKMQALCKKPFRCELCEESFVRQDSLNSHMRHHKEMDKAMDAEAQSLLESTAHAVLSLANPSNLGTIPSHGPTTSTQVPDAGQSIEVTLSSEEDLLQHTPVSAPILASTPVIPQGHIMVRTPATITHTPQPKPVSPAKKPRGPHYTYRHVLSQDESKRLARVQNNHNQAIEENYQNAALAAQAAAKAANSQRQHAIRASYPILRPPNTIVSASPSRGNVMTPALANYNNNQQVHVPQTNPQVNQTATLIQQLSSSAPPMRLQNPQVVCTIPQSQITSTAPQSRQRILIAPPQANLTQQTLQQIVNQQNSQQTQVLNMIGNHQNNVQNSGQTILQPNVSSCGLQVVATASGNTQTMSSPSLLTLQSSTGQTLTPVKVQLLQDASGNPITIPQQVQVLLPASALASYNVQHQQTSGTSQPVVIQLPQHSGRLPECVTQIPLPYPVQVQAQQPLVLGKAQHQQLPPFIGTVQTNNNIDVAKHQ